MTPNFAKLFSLPNPGNRKIKLYCAGVGFSFADIIARPGCSSLLSDIHYLYSEESLTRLFSVEKAVSRETAVNLAIHQQGDIVVGVTGAITSARYRRGNNEAYIALMKPDLKSPIVKHVKLFKMPEAEHLTNNISEISKRRRSEDHQICNAVIDLIVENW